MDACPTKDDTISLGVVSCRKISSFFKGGTSDDEGNYIGWFSCSRSILTFDCWWEIGSKQFSFYCAVNDAWRIGFVLHIDILDLSKHTLEDLLRLGQHVFLLKQVRFPLWLARITAQQINNLQLPLRYTLRSTQFLQLINHLVSLISNWEKQKQPELLFFRCLSTLHDLWDPLEVVMFAWISCSGYKVLFNLTNLIEITPLNELLQLLEDVKMLGCISFVLLELREVLNHSLHVFNCFELGLRLFRWHEGSHELFDLLCELTEVLVHYSSEEFIVVTAKNKLSHLRLQVFKMFQINPVVFNL